MRIISGTFKGRRLKSPKGMDTRPTLDRVRETIFNVLQHHCLTDRKVLDLFAGTGAMGLEALSRGASELVAIDKKTSHLIKENAELCGVSQKTVVYGRSIELSCSLMQKERFDLIFSDPPYNKGLINKTIECIEKYELANEEALIVLEADKDEPYTVPKSWQLWKEQSFGYTRVYYFIYKNEGESPCE